MPRIKERFFPVAQKINRDPEVRKLKHELGLTGFSMWLQVLAETDGQKGLWKGSARDIGGVLAGVCETNSRGSARFLQWVTDRGWILWQRGSAIDSWWGLIVAKFLKYHNFEIDKDIPGKTDKKTLPSEPSEPNLPKKSKKTSFPLDFAIGPQLKSWCLQQHVFDPELYLEAFKDHHIAKGSRFDDWEAAFRTWIRNRERFGPRKVVTQSAADQLRLRTAETLKRGL